VTPAELAAVLDVLRARGVARFEGCGVKVEFARSVAALADDEKPRGAPSMTAEERLAALSNPLVQVDD
jgi:hypothetical protein